MIRQAAALSACVGLLSCAPVGQPGSYYAAIEDDPAVRATGEARRCLQTTRIRHTKVQGNGAIDFEMVGGRVYRNLLGYDCPGLRPRKPISYDVRGDSLCRGDVIYVLERFADNLERGPACGLGEYTEIEYVDDISDAPLISGE